jgi:L-asparaginase
MPTRCSWIEIDEMTEIAILEMGGTINGILSPGGVTPKESKVIPFLTNSPIYQEIKFTSEIVALKDSRDVVDTDRQALSNAIRCADTLRILVPHGTFTMSETGEFLLDALADELGRKSVILTGAMIPLGEPESDGPDNLEFAVDRLLAAPIGVWIAMNNNLWNPRAVIKDPETGEFIGRNEV